MRHHRNLARRAEDAARDLVVLDWQDVALPDAWPDQLDLRHPAHLLTYVRRWFGPRRKVELPPGLPGAARLPGYLRQEFHHLPNGIYSKRHARGYVRWFDHLMLGHTVRARARLAAGLLGCRAVLDIGCGGGALAGEMHAAGIPEVWGLEPSPYLLQLAATRCPGVRFVQGVVERTDFPSARFDGVGSCFLWHELPPRVADAALEEIRRILAPGGRLVIAEPSPAQFHPHEWRELIKSHGWQGLYFSLIAKWMHEPFVQRWHRREVGSWLDAHGFTLDEDETGMPIRFVTAHRRA